MIYAKHGNAASTEDELRDLEERDINDGWPYSDTPGAASDAPENRAYGETAGNFDRDTNGGYRIDTVEADGEEKALKDGLSPATIGREDSDDIESRIAERFETVDDMVLDNIEISVDGHTATLSGMVDTNEEMRMAARLALSVPGVRHVINEIEAMGVDAHQPDED
ncbi:BON domain-containing protein [Agrobacterium vitis]|uniref:BON domain-containing protein n=1 Tax=Agrobacterium vitis TaxID=373 RepID=UPI0015DB697A|nr:BON domain-containing protein [Agrobacterium vitis]MCF1453128.1 BON domain-containing protein [Agrobacterium vitis]BCH54205.1 transporter [Agrobacterium vitis]